MGTVDLPYVMTTQAKGRTYCYYRRAGQLIPIKDDGNRPLLPGMPGFGTAYEAIHLSFEVPNSTGGLPGSIHALVTEYFASAEYRQLGDRAKAEYKTYLEILRDELGGFQIRQISKRVVLKHRDKMADTPSKANHFVKVVRLWLNWCLSREWIKANPAIEIKDLRTGPGWEAWPDAPLATLLEESRRVARHGAYMAYYTGQRKGDILVARWDAITAEGKIFVKQNKTSKELLIPLHPALAAELATIKRKGMTIIGRRNGQPLTESGFNSIWRREKARLGLDGQFHGLRSNSVEGLLLAGCTEAEVESITGMSPEMIQHYSRKVNQTRLAETGMNKWALASQRGNDSG